MKKADLYLRFEIDPVAKGRPRFTRAGIAYKPKKTRDFENEIRFIAMNQYGGSLVDGPIKVQINFNFKPGKTVKRKHHTTRPDCSNLAKGVEDALNGVVWKDDSQIIDLRVVKQYALESFIEVFIKSV